MKIGNVYREKTPGTNNIIKITKISEFKIEYDLFMDEFSLTGEISGTNGQNVLYDFNNIYEFSEKLTEQYMVKDITE